MKSSGSWSSEHSHVCVSRSLVGYSDNSSLSLNGRLFKFYSPFMLEIEERKRGAVECWPEKSRRCTTNQRARDVGTLLQVGGIETALRSGLRNTWRNYAMFSMQFDSKRLPVSS